MSKGLPGWAEVEEKLLRRKTSNSKDLWRSIHRKTLDSISPEDEERALDGMVAFVHQGFDERRGRPGPMVSLGDLVLTSHRLVFVNDDMRAVLPLRDFDSVTATDCKAGLLKRVFAIRARSGSDDFVWTGANQESARSLFEALEAAHAQVRDRLRPS